MGKRAAKNIEEAILAEAKKRCDAAEAIAVSSEKSPVVFENNRLKSIQTVESTGYGLRVIKDGRVGFTSGTKVESAKNFVARAVESAKFGDKACFELPAQSKPPSVKLFDERVPAFSREKAISGGEAVIARLLAGEPELQCGFQFEKAAAKVRIINSRGLDLRTERTAANYSIEAFKVSDAGFLTLYEYDAKRSADLDFGEHVDKLLRYFKLCRKEAAVGVEKMPVIFSSLAAMMVASAFAIGVDGKLVQKGMSPLAGRKGEKILGDCVNIYDDPTVDFASGSFSFDSEGLPGYRKPLYEKGVLKNFVFDLRTAGLMGEKSTANASRGFGSLPSPSVSNLIFEPGAVSLKDMLKGVKRGVLVEQLLGGGQSNLLAGEFSANLDLAFLIENGEPVARLKDAMVAFNVYEAFNNNIEALGSEARMTGGISTPPILFGALSVSGKK